MKKHVFLILFCLCLGIGLTACSDDEPTTPSAVVTEAPVNTTAEETASTETQPAEKAFEPFVLAENADCLVRVVGMEHQEVWGLVVRLSCENKTDTGLLFSLQECTINGYFVEPGWITQVDPGQTKESEFYIFENEMERCGFTEADELSFRLLARDPDHYSAVPKLDEKVALYPTGKTAKEIRFLPREPGANDHPVVEEERFRVLITETDPAGFWGYTLYLYVENNTDQALVFNWKDVRINGEDFEPYWIYELPANMRGYAVLAVSREDLTAKGVDDPKDFDFLLNVYNSENFEDLYAEHCTVVLP